MQELPSTVRDSPIHLGAAHGQPLTALPSMLRLFTVMGTARRVNGCHSWFLPTGLCMFLPVRTPRLVTVSLMCALLTVLVLPSVGDRLLRVPAAEPAASSPPRLAVLVVFDQMRGDYLARWEKLFGNRGFRRLQQEGAWFTNCHYPYSDTITAAGHASIATGCSPAEHGIIENDWYDRTIGQS